ncbi:MAG TPA: hypothetical protein VK809_01065 [Bacteroidia bacterium]|jgi:hypothetical protein|nr:hypothetical protein [Bacteroidia bacterium]
MKNYKIFLVALFVCLLPFTNLHAQMDGFINAGPSDLKIMQSRTLLVEIKEEDQKVEASLAKNKKDPDAVQHYKDFITNNNSMLKKAVDKYWKFNSTVQYKTSSDLMKLVGKSDQYVIISFQGITGDNFEETTAFDMPVIIYNRSERTGKQEPDDYMYMPPSSIPDNPNSECWTYAQSAYDFAIIQMQANIDYMIKNNKKIRYLDYAKKISEEKKCGELQTETLVMDNSMLDDKVDESAIKSFYKGPIELTDGKSDETFENHVQGKEVIFSFPYGVASTSISIATISALYSAKAIVDCKTGELIYFYLPPSGMNMGTATTWQFKLRKYFFYYMQKCK